MAKKSIKKNYLLNLIYQITLVIIPLIVTPYVSRILLADGVGKYSFASSLITYFTLFASFGFESYAQREIANCQKNPEQQSKVFYEILVSRLVPVSLSILVNFILLFTNVYGSYTQLMQILTINIFAVALDIAFYFQGNEEFGKLVTRNVILKILGTISIFIFIKEQSDLWLYAVIQVLIVLISNISLWPYLLKRLKKVNFKELKPLRHLKGSLKLFVPALAVSLYTVLDKTLIGLITNSDAQNGYYEQAEKIVKLSMTLITCLAAVMIPRNSAEIAQNNHEKVKENVYKSCNFIWLLCLPMMFGMILVADNFVPWFLGTNFNESILLIKVFSPLVLIIGLSSVFGKHYMIPYKKEKQYTISIIIGSLVNLTLNLILIYFFNSLGATIATIIAESCVTITMFIFIKNELSIKRILKTSIKPLIASIIMFIVTFPISIYLSSSILNSILIVLIGLTVYGIAILVLKEKLAIESLRSVFKKLKKDK